VAEKHGRRTWSGQKTESQAVAGTGRKRWKISWSSSAPKN